MLLGLYIKNTKVIKKGFFFCLFVSFYSTIKL